MDQLAIAIPVGFIYAFVEILKELGMPSQYARIAVFGLGLVMAIVYQLNPSIMDIVVRTVGFALSAIGVYEIKKGITTTIVNSIK